MKRIVSFVLIICLCMSSLTGCGLMERATNTFNSASESAKKMSNQIYEWGTNIDLSIFSKGWDYASKFASTTYSSIISTEYINKVASQINTLKIDINQSMHNARGIAQEAGFLAEKWAVDTFNINAAAANSSSYVSRPNSNKAGSADIETSWGENYSLKYYQNADSSAKAQAATIFQKYSEYKSNAGENALSMEDWMNKNISFTEVDSILQSLYCGQERLIPADQLEAATQYLQLKIAKESTSELKNRKVLSKTLEETLDHLADRVTSPDGIESVPLTLEESRAIAELARDGKFKPEDFNITLSSVIKPKYVISQAMQAGITASSLRVVLEIGPDIFSLLKKLANDEKIDDEELKEIGIDALLAGGEGFLEGSVSNLLYSACKMGKFGKELTEANPSIIAELTVITIDAIRYGYLLSKGEITAMDYSNLIAERIIIACASEISSSAMNYLFPNFSIAYMIGSMAGSILASIGISYAKEVILQVTDNMGFAAIIPQKATDGLNVAKDAIANLDIKDWYSNMKDTVLTVLNNGVIRVKLST